MSKKVSDGNLGAVGRRSVRTGTGCIEAKKNENAEYHVICGLFGNVYAGTYTGPCKDFLQEWRNVKDVTSEAIEAVVNHFIIKMEHDGKNKVQKVWGVRGGKKLKVTFELSNDKEQSDE